MRAIIFDTETTGTIDPGIVQDGWIECDHMGVTVGDLHGQLWNPGKPSGFGALATHHITDDMVADAQPASEFALPPGVTHIIGHKVDFDWEAAGRPDVKRICTLALARRMWPDLDSHTLGALTYRIIGSAAREALRDAHDARADVMLCANVLRAICAARQPTSLDDLWRMSEDARIPTHISFGKHAGKPISMVPSDYRSWYRRQDETDPYLLEAFKRTPALV